MISFKYKEWGYKKNSNFHLSSKKLLNITFLNTHTIALLLNIKFFSLLR